jgi:aspartyl-tRNA(Asn)/glutamyl-tRNA(Gln) amidotransferase subunit C
VRISADDVRHAAALAHIGLDDAELEALTADVQGILEHIGRISELDLADVPPTSHALDLTNTLRDDEPRPSWPRESLLKLAPDPAPDGFRVPPIGA